MDLAKNLKIDSVSRLHPTPPHQVGLKSTVADAIQLMREKRVGCVLVCEAARVVGIFTDGDLRRLIEKKQDFNKLSINDVMHRKPHTVKPDQLAVEAVELMEKFRINQLLVVKDDETLVGAIHIHDLTRAKVI